MDPMRGLLNGLIAGALLWALILGVVWALLA